MLLVWRKLSEPLGVPIAPDNGGELIHTLAEPIPFLMDYPLEGLRRSQPCGRQLVPEDQQGHLATMPPATPIAPRRR